MRTAPRCLAVLLVGILYTSLFWLRPPSTWPSWIGLPRRHLIDGVAALTGLPTPWAWALLGVFLGGIVPGLLLFSTRHRLGEILLGRGRAEGWRLAALGFALALPALIYLAARPEFRHYYTATVRHGLLLPALRFVVVIVAEHVCIQGAVLRLALGPAAGWPPPPAPVAARGAAPRLQWLLGLGPGPGPCRRLGVDGPVVAALITQALVFGWVHVSKDLGELVLSFPGGLALGYLTWRARSVWPGVALHACTGTAVIALAILLYGLPHGGW